MFKQEAAEEMRVKHRTSIRGGETVHDCTKLEVEARPPARSSAAPS